MVDDDALFRWALTETLSACGHDVVEAADAEGALQAVTSVTTPFDVVLLDFRLPDSSDLALMSRLRRLSPSAQIIVMTSYGTNEILRGALDLGAHSVINKPFEISQVAQLVAGAHASRC